jgi:UDP-N-acetylglucosamine diphosphorylase / glucose-1-phosphate thymidylyltransferase / UDP-N-acetylgalactosamine diphosphorylase / glucosamine-1-phosphate N-acetyltransferase / galactosamine-1-phosphate N-acetyltransferase
MKALILAGGRGKRLDELSKNKNKCMIEVHGRPVIEYSLDNAASTDVDEILLVVGYRAEEIINHYGISYKGKRLRYVLQWEQKGLVHAMECAAEALAGDDFMLLLGDEIMLNPRHAELITSFRNDKAFAVCGVLLVEDRELIRRTYTLIQDENQVIHRLVEKPRKPFNNLMGTGDCIFSNRILEYIAVTPIHHERQEKELPDLIQCAIDDGNTVTSFLICDGYGNINEREDIDLADLVLG